jgi:hypothetical protein
MRSRDCRLIRRQLSAFHDGELPVGEQVAVEVHLRECPACAAEVETIEALGACVRAGASSNGVDPEFWEGLPSIVVSRMKAEEAESISGRTGRMFEDLHLVWAALGATGATVACLALIFTICYFAVTSPAGSNQNPAIPNAFMTLPSMNSDIFPVATPTSDEESVLALSAVVSKEGKFDNIALITSTGAKRRANKTDGQAVKELVDALSKVRVTPARYAGSPAPVAVDMVWLYASLTVKAKMPEVQLTPRKPARVPNTISEHTPPVVASIAA